MANLGNKNLIFQKLILNFLHFGVETGIIDLRQPYVVLIRSRERLNNELKSNFK